MSLRLKKKEDNRYYLQENNASTLFIWKDVDRDGKPVSYKSRNKAEKMHPDIINKFHPK
jgi:hypothetical protein